LDRPERNEVDGSPAVPAPPATAPGALSALLGELQRRRVFRAVVVYGAVAFAVLQVIEPIMHGLRLPEWVLSVTVVVLGLGFPLVIGLAWAFDLNSTGVERTPPVALAGRPAPPQGVRLPLILAGLGLLLALPGVTYHFVWGAGARRDAADARQENPLADARFQPLTDFSGIEQAAAISRDGRFVAFQSDRDGPMDVWVTQVGTGQFVNLTHGNAPEIVNSSLRALGFSPDGTLVTFWGRTPRGGKGPDIGVWGAPLLGGQPRPYLEGIAEFDWSSDGNGLVYHTPGPGDPMYVSDDGTVAGARTIFSAPAGLHAHFLAWAPDRSFIYFVLGALPDRLDLWRIRPGGGTPERITHHDAIVSHPVFLDARTILYLATDPDGFGPFIHSLDLDQGTSRRVSSGVDGYTSLAASADGRRLVATLANRKGTLWRVPLRGGTTDMASARRIPLTTGHGSSPRLGPDYLLYTSSKGPSDSLWKLDGTASTEIWSAPETRFIGAPAIRRDGRRIAFSVRQGRKTLLYAVNQDGSDSRVVTSALELRGAPAWTSDGRSITVAAVTGGLPRLFNVPVDGGAPTPFLGEQALDPAWSPEGDLLVYSGADVGTAFPVKAARADGSAAPLPQLTLTRGARHLAFVPQRRALLVLRGDLRHKDLWQVDLGSGVEQRVTTLPADYDLRDFDVAPDGGELVLEQVQVHADVVLIERPRR
jgi:Tol biopolymer transport system component